LLALVNHLVGRQLQARPRPAKQLIDASALPDLADVRGQTIARRALEVAAAGGHNLLVRGPSGARLGFRYQSLSGSAGAGPPIRTILPK
ncbi:MAG: hypothetical protein EON59_16000, partial [Alphaproteobacteria bacterium]